MTNGLPVAVPVSPAAAYAIHQLDLAPTTNDANGRPYSDVVTLELLNGDTTNPASVIVTLTPPGGAAVTLTVDVPAGEKVRLFDETALGGTPLGLIGTPPQSGAVIALQLAAGAELSANVRAWGWFVRS